MHSQLLRIPTKCFVCFVCVCVCVCCRTATWQGYRMSMYTAFDGAYLIGVTTQMTCIKSANVI